MGGTVIVAAILVGLLALLYYQGNLFSALSATFLAVMGTYYTALLWAGTVVAKDAAQRGRNGAVWGLMCVTPIGPLILLLYLAVRHRAPAPDWGETRQGS